MHLTSPRHLVLGLAIPAVGVALVALALWNDSLPRPRPGDFMGYEIAHPELHAIGSTSPEIVAPGDTVRVTVSREEPESIYAYWRAEKIQLTPRPVRLADGTEVTWEPTEVGGSSKQWGEEINVGTVRGDARPLHKRSMGRTLAWVRFRLPDDERLVGYALPLHVHLEGICPVLALADGYGFVEKTFVIDRDIDVQLGTAGEIAAYRAFNEAWDDWFLAADLEPILNIAALVLCLVAFLVGIGFLRGAFARSESPKGTP